MLQVIIILCQIPDDGTVAEICSSYFYVLLTVHPCIIFLKLSQIGAHYFLAYLFQFLYMFRTTTCPSSRKLTVSVRHWYFSLCMGGCLVDWSGPARCTLLLSTLISISLHVSGNYVPIIRRTYCICATLVFFTLYGWLSGLQNRQPPIQCEKYQCRTDRVSFSDDSHIVARNV